MCSFRTGSTYELGTCHFPYSYEVFSSYLECVDISSSDRKKTQEAAGMCVGDLSSTASLKLHGMGYEE